MSVVKMNVLTVSPDQREELERRFAARAGLVDSAEGFEGFQLLRPVEGTDRYLVCTWWRSEEDFRHWLASQDFQRGHAQAGGAGHGHGGEQRKPAASDSEVWSFEVIQESSPA